MRDTANQAWLKLLFTLLATGREISPRGMKSWEHLNYTSKVEMRYPVVTVERRRLGYRFMPAEAAWILSGDNRTETIAPYSNRIADFSDDGQFFRGAYGPPIVDQIGWCADQLLDDTWSRQSVLTIWRPRPPKSRDIPCTVAMQFIIRPDSSDADRYRLNTLVTMRSSDAWLGWPYDVFNFSMISGYLIALLQNRRPSWEIEPGTLYLTAGSQHLYDSNRDAAEDIINEDPATFEYAPFDPSQYFIRPTSLIDHLWAVADRKWDELRSPWLAELFTDDEKRTEGKS